MRKSEVQKMTSIAVPFGNGCHVVTPKSFLNKRVWILTQEEWQNMKQQIDFMKEQLRGKG